MMTKKKNKKVWSRVLIAYLVFAVLLVAELARSNLIIGVSKYTVESEKIPSQFDGYRIAFLSDLHLRSFGNKNCKLIKKIDAQNPNIVIMGGDMVNSGEPNCTVALELAMQLAEKYPVYYCGGNHERDRSTKERLEFYEQLEQSGVTLISNKILDIQHNGSSIALAGLDLPLYYYSRLTKDGTPQYAVTPQIISDFIGDVDNQQFTILAAHNPYHFNSYGSWGADVTLSGHIHGGVVRIPFLGGVFSPNIELFPELDAGQYNVGSSQLVVSRGLNEHSIHLRFFNPADLCMIILNSR